MPSSGPSLFSKSTLKSIFTGKDESLTLDNPKKWMVVAHTSANEPTEGGPNVFKTEFSLWKFKGTKFPTDAIQSYANDSSRAMFNLTQNHEITQALTDRSTKKNWTVEEQCEELAKLLAGSMKDIKADKTVAKEIDTRVLSTKLYKQLEASDYELQWNLGDPVDSFVGQQWMEG